MINVERFRPHPIQKLYYQSRARFIANDSGRGSGKTDITQRKLVKAMLTRHPECDRPLYGYGLPTGRQADLTVWEDIIKIFPPGVVKVAARGSGVIELVEPFNSKLYLFSMYNPTRIEGQQYCGFVLDEMSDQKPKVFDLNVLPALSRWRGFCYCIGIPKRAGIGAECFRRYCEEWENDPTGVHAHFHWTSDGVIPDTELEIARRTLDLKDFREQYLASWENAAGAVYYAFDQREHTYSGNQYREDMPLLIGSDFNIDPMSWIIAQADFDKDGHCAFINVIDEISKRNTYTQETLNELWNRWGHHKAGFKFYGDAAGRSGHTSAALSDYIQIKQDKRFWQWTQQPTGEMVKMPQIYYPKCNPAVADRVAAVNAMLKNAAGFIRMTISKRCSRLIKDLEHVSYIPGTREIDKRDKDATHMSDALGYLVSAIAPVTLYRQKAPGQIITQVFKTPWQNP